jgi:hypothetical protein
MSANGTVNTWKEIMEALGRSPRSGQGKAQVKKLYGDILRRDPNSNRIWAFTEELNARRKALSKRVCKIPVKP